MSAKKFAISTLLVLSACALVAGCGSDDPVLPTSNDAPILPPQNIIVQQTDNGSVMITWAANTQSILAGYNVYRNDVAASAIVTLTPNPITVNFYEDTTVEAGGRYEYWVTSVSSKGDESTYELRPISIGRGEDTHRDHEEI